MRFKIKNPIAFWYKLAKALALVATGFWLLETAYFLFTEGWHLRATSPAEIWCDAVVRDIGSGAMLALFLAVIELLEQRMMLDRQWESFSKEMEKAEKEATLEGLRDEDLTPQMVTENHKPE